MKTIRKKIFVVFAIFMFFLVMFGMILNSIFLKYYYVYKNRGMFLAVSEEISKSYMDDRENLYQYINGIDNIDGINVTIVNKDSIIEYMSLRQKSISEGKMLAKEIKEIILENENKISKKYLYYTDELKNDKKTRLIFISKMSNGNFIILKKPIKSINESVLIANQFYIFSAIIVILIGSIIIFIFSKRLTKPIIEMCNVAENIANLEFDKRIKIQSKDEIGKLGESINKISEKLCASINDLKQDVERRKQLVRDMSHELKTPIGIIKGYAEGLKYGVANDKEKVQKYCSVLVKECDKMDNIVKELLTHSMIESEIFEMKKTSFNISEFISDIVTRFNPVFIDKNINFELKCPDSYMVFADREMLEKAINNFITNAIDYVSEEKCIRLNVEEIVNGLRISVFNTGEHIPKYEMEKIWDMYYKVDKSRSRTYGGHGIGLSIVKLIAKIHGGIAKVENIEDGVRFLLEIPNYIVEIDNNKSSN